MNFRVAKAWTVQAPGHLYRLAVGTLIRILELDEYSDDVWFACDEMGFTAQVNQDDFDQYTQPV